MTPAPAPTYDAIAEEYKRSKSLPFRKHVEAHTLFGLIGDPTGLAVLDLACGDGIYTREVRRRGAGKALGVDVSQEMLRLADASERAEPLGCRYFLSDVLNLRRLGAFDVVIGAYLLNYARSAMSGGGGARKSSQYPSGYARSPSSDSSRSHQSKDWNPASRKASWYVSGASQ
jgi:SAM-dependent methyltransferase